MLLYYITDRTQFSGNESARRAALLAKIAEAACAGVDYIQLREKDLASREVESLAQDAIRIVREIKRLPHREPATRVLINSRTDVALAVDADGVHLRSDDLSTQDVRDLISRSGRSTTFLIARACHSAESVRIAASAGADFAVFAPVFEKRDAPDIHPAGLELLSKACRASIPTFALGGITLSNAATCIAAGAAGIAAIRLFQENPINEVVRALRT